MLFGYSEHYEEEVIEYCNALKKNNVLPTMSCVLSDKNVNDITNTIGID